MAIKRPRISYFRDSDSEAEFRSGDEAGFHYDKEKFPKYPNVMYPLRVSSSTSWTIDFFEKLIP